VTEEPWLVWLGFSGPGALTKGQGKRIVIGEQLRGLTIGALSFHGLDWVVLAIQPCALNVNVLLRVSQVAGLAVQVLPSQTGESSSFLHINGSCIASSLFVVLSLELLYSLSRVGLGWCTMEILEGSIEVALVMTLLETSDNWTEASLSASNGTAIKDIRIKMITRQGSTQRYYTCWSFWEQVSPKFCELLGFSWYSELKFITPSKYVKMIYILTKPSSGITCLVSGRGTLAIAPSGFGKPLDVRQLMSDSFSLIYKSLIRDVEK
jgi:hypothetical protein